MKKEVILAIAIGFALGLVITFGIWTANKSLKNLPKASQPTPTSEAVAATPASTPSSNQTISLTISSPADESLTNSNKTTVSGTTVANAIVVIFSEDSQQIVSADDKGNFTADMGLVGGYNTIRVAAFDFSGNTTEQSITITYTTAKI